MHLAISYNYYKIDTAARYSWKCLGTRRLITILGKKSHLQDIHTLLDHSGDPTSLLNYDEMSLGTSHGSIRYIQITALRTSTAAFPCHDSLDDQYSGRTRTEGSFREALTFVFSSIFQSCDIPFPSRAWNWDPRTDFTMEDKAHRVGFSVMSLCREDIHTEGEVFFLVFLWLLSEATTCLWINFLDTRCAST